MTTKVFDTFTGTAGTDLSAHTPDTDVVGGGWIDYLANSCELDGSGAVQFDASGRSSWIDAGTVNQWCTANFYPGSADNRFSFLLRRDSAAYSSRTCYDFNFRTGDGVNPVIIYKTVSGSNTQLAAKSGSAWDNTATYSCEPEIDGSALDFIVDGVSEVSVSDASITTGDYAGIIHQKYTTGNARLYDFKIDDTAPAAGSFQPAWAKNVNNLLGAGNV